MDRLRLKNDAKQDIRGKLWLALQPMIIMYLISYFVSFFATAANRTDNHDVYIALTVIYSVLSIAYFVIYFPMYVGVSKFYLDFTADRYNSWGVIFDSFKDGKQFLQQLICYIMTGLIVIAGTICFVIPGIYLALLYSMTGYAFAENPSLKWREAMKRSSDLMHGHVFELFCLVFSFFFWWCLVAITFGIAIIYVGPYMNCTMARYYKSLAAVFDGNSSRGGYTSGGDYPFNDNPFRAGNSDDDNPFSDGNDSDTKYPFDIQ